MNKTPNFPARPSPFEMLTSPTSKDPAHSKQPDGRVPHMLKDALALEEWQCNLEKMRLKDAHQ